MQPELDEWFQSHSTKVSDWSVPELVELKEHLGTTISVVVPARNEASTIGPIVDSIRENLVERDGLVDELIVLDSDSSDNTASVARDAGAEIYSSIGVRPDLGSYAGKGEAVWKSLFVTTGDILAYVDGDVTDFRPDFVVGTVAPLLASQEVCLVKGFYDRDLGGPDGRAQGGRVSELAARPVINLWWPELAAVIQPLSGEWACRRELIEGLWIPTGYGVEIATLIDTFEMRGLAAVAQVDLGSRSHRHQDLLSLSSMAAEVIAAATSRKFRSAPPDPAELSRLVRVSDNHAWTTTRLSVKEREPAARHCSAALPGPVERLSGGVPTC